MLRVLRSIWIWTASAALVLSWAPHLGLIRLLDRDPLHLRTGRWFRRLGRLLAKVNPWRLHISGLEHLTPNQAYVIESGRIVLEGEAATLAKDERVQKAYLGGFEAIAIA